MPCANDCNDHGTCVNNDCSCDLGYFSDSLSKTKCTIPGSNVWGGAWTFFQVFFNISFSILFVFSLSKLYRSLKQEKTYDCKNKLKRLFLSPKNLSLLSICLICIIKVIWLSYDPLIFDNRSNRMADRLLFETIYPILFNVLASVLLVWSGIYQGLRKIKTDPFKILSKIIVALMILVFPFTWMLSISQGVRAEQEPWYWAGYIGLAIGSSVLSLLFFTFSLLLYKYVSKNKVGVKKKNKMQTPRGRYENNGTSNGAEDGNGVENLFNFEGFDENLNGVGEGKASFVELSVDDKKVVKKLVVITSTAGISGLLIIAVGTPFTLTDSLTHPDLTYFGLFFGFFLELVICVLVAVVFTTQIYKSHKDNIKQMVYLARKIRGRSPEIKLSPEYKEISRRLQMYYL